MAPDDSNAIRQALLALRGNAMSFNPTNLAQRIKTGRHWWNLTDRRGSRGVKFSRKTQIT
jgi:hypothetical protein